MPETLKEYSHYLVCIFLNGGKYKLIHMLPDKFNALENIAYNGHRYKIDRDQVVRLHGWVPWKPTNPWNPWRMVYNGAYAWYHATGLILFHEPSDPLHGIEIPVEPIKMESPQQKWTPAIVRGVALSPLYSRYNRQLGFGSFRMSWKMWVLLGVVAIFILLLVTGRLNFLMVR